MHVYPDLAVNKKKNLVLFVQDAPQKLLIKCKHLSGLLKPQRAGSYAHTQDRFEEAARLQ